MSFFFLFYLKIQMALLNPVKHSWISTDIFQKCVQYLVGNEHSSLVYTSTNKVMMLRAVLGHSSWLTQDNRELWLDHSDPSVISPLPSLNLDFFYT